MPILLDTHAFLWFVLDDPQLSSHARQMIENGKNTSHVSIATLWEVAIKVCINKISLTEDFDVLIPREMAGNRFELLSLEIPHTCVIASLPLHHRDPFDRLLIAQALEESMPVVSKDAQFDAYGVQRIW